MKTPAQLLHTDTGRAQVWHQINRNERADTFASRCIRCQAQTPHKIIVIGRFVTWQCQRCGHPFEDSVYERPKVA